MTALFYLWSRRLWPYVTLTTLIAFGLLAYGGWRTKHERHALSRAHQATIYAHTYVYATDTVYRHDTVVAARAVVKYREKRDTVLQHLTDTVEVKAALADCDSAIGTLQSALGSASRLIDAHLRYEYALTVELAASERLRAPRYSVASRAGMEWGTNVPVTELESTVRITKDWAIVGRVSKRWTAGEPTRRYLLASYTF